MAKKQHKKRVQLYMLEKGLEKIEKEAKEFGLNTSKYIAVVLSHAHADVAERIRKGEIIIVP